MNIKIVHTGLFKLDGGAMFGVVPKSMWKKLNPPDENNMCTWAMRCLLIETGDRKILVDTGLGDKQDEKFRSHFEPHGSQNLITSLEELDLVPEDITDVFLTHLHFDHVGGAIKRGVGDELVPTFPNAVYWSNEKHYQWAIHPNERERASFLKENFVPLSNLDCLQYIPVQETPYEWLPGIIVHYLYGHTEAMMALEIEVGTKTFFYCADLIPSSFHIGLPYVMSYDIRPLISLQEKRTLLEKVVGKNWILLFEHDPETECATLIRNEKGRITLDKRLSLEEALEG
ncbi:MAG: MBL fold metallo-hydrolase [Saprospiraceae bacterium]|nr:MBL fold metallo-hydrolase [Saprospiraceae bacterium]